MPKKIDEQKLIYNAILSKIKESDLFPLSSFNLYDNKINFIFQQSHKHIFLCIFTLKYEPIIPANFNKNCLFSIFYKILNCI